eukprot:3579742-Pleurochrysis_carterae.AAC.2
MRAWACAWSLCARARVAVRVRLCGATVRARPPDRAHAIAGVQASILPAASRREPVTRPP